MIYGSNEKGEAIFTLSPDEHVMFKDGLTIGHVVQSASGTYRITVRMTRTRGPEGSRDRLETQTPQRRATAIGILRGRRHPRAWNAAQAGYLSGLWRLGTPRSVQQCSLLD